MEEEEKEELPLMVTFVFVQKAHPPKGRRLITLFTAVKIHMVEMSRRYYGSISSAAVIFTRRASANVKQWPGPRRQAANQAATDLLSAVIDERRARGGLARRGGPGGGRRRWRNSLLVSQVLGGCRLNSCLTAATLRPAVVNGDGGANESDGSEVSFLFPLLFSAVRIRRLDGVFT